MTDIVAALDALSAGIAAARALDLDVEPAELVHKEATERLGIAPDTYVLALVGGTGVGKSTLLNALAGETVSPASARRPTTGRPVAWASTDTVDDLRPLLEHLDVESVRTHQQAGLGRVVVLDLPDVDSLDETHRSAVEGILPKVDVVAWVTDPEKYADAVLHDDFLRTWMGRLDRQIVILNKTDRLGPVAVRSVAADLAHVLKRELPAIHGKPPPVVRAAAIQGEAGVSELRSWLAQAADAKTVVADRLVASARAALAALAALAGVTVAGAAPLVNDTERAIAIDRGVFEVLRVVDLSGAQRQAVAATRAQARWRGTGPIGLVTSVAYRLAGRERRSADPGGYLRTWRTRGTLTRAADAVRKTISDAMPNVAPGLRARFAAATEAGTLERRLETALDRVVARQPDL
ncbi:MAG TPA: GTPase, partial [Candidatus Eisenbacteria bacterium]|nr:GTPase [Candidatus Eisenbacteria bacterium]